MTASAATPEDEGVPVSVKIRERVLAARKRFHANDNISEFIQPGELEKLLEQRVSELQDTVERIREALPSGGRFSGQWYGPRDSWVERPGMTFLSRDEALALLQGLELEMFEEEESDGVTPRGNAKHWHIFHIVAKKS